MGKSVTYNDYLKFNYYIGKALIENQSITFNDQDIKSFSLLNDSKNQNIVQNYFKNIFYYPSENKWIDNIVVKINQMNTYPNEVLEFKKSIAFYALFQSCLIKRPFNLFHRKNLYLRKNKVKRSFGNLTSWNKPFEDYFVKFITEANNLIFNNNKNCVALNESVFELKKTNYDLVYLDPPYFRKNSSNETSYYSKTYHFLEGLANYNIWENLIDVQTINKRFKKDDDNYIGFGSEDITESFDRIFAQFKKSKS